MLREIGLKNVWILALVAIIVLANTIIADSYPGQARFRATRSTLDIPHGLVGVVFDTSKYVGSQDSLSNWQFVGTLKIDSVIFASDGGNTAMKLTDQDYLAGFSIGSPELIRVLEKYRPRRLVKRVPSFNPADTLSTYEVRGKRHSVSDLSRFFKIIVDNETELDPIFSALKDVPGVDEVGAVGKPIPCYHEEIIPDQR
jgi:hypothetical protein